jgi:hypothetical protein
MRTFTSGKGKVHHIPARNEEGSGFLKGYTIYLCGRESLNGVAHEGATPTCQACLGKLRMAEFEANWQSERMRQQAENEAAYGRIAQREAEEKAAREVARVTPTVHVVQLSPWKNAGTDTWKTDVPTCGGKEPATLYRMRSAYGRGDLRFTVLYIGPDGEGRREHQGPILPGPYCALIPESSVISSHEQPKEKVVEVKEGDVLILNGAPMILIDDQSYGYPHAVTPTEYGARLAAREVSSLRKEKLTATGERAWDMALQEVQTRITSLYRNGHTVLPFAFEPPPVKVVPEHVLHLNDGDRLRVLGAETLGGEPGIWATRLYPSGEEAETEWWPLKYLIQDEASAFERFRSHVLERPNGMAYLVLGSETMESTGRAGVWLNPVGDEYPRWVAEDILLRDFAAPAR